MGEWVGLHKSCLVPIAFSFQAPCAGLEPTTKGLGVPYSSRAVGEPSHVAALPPALLDNMSTDLRMACDPEGDNKLLDHYNPHEISSQYKLDRPLAYGCLPRIKRLRSFISFTCVTCYER